MALKSDAQGFLIGSPIEMGDLSREMRVLRREAEGIRMSLRARQQGRREAAKVAVEAPKGAAVAQPGRRGGKSRPDDDGE
ncbi:MAG TPA: hypothetical protein VIG97_07430, partial [Luteimonas sp.]